MCGALVKLWAAVSGLLNGLEVDWSEEAQTLAVRGSFAGAWVHLAIAFGGVKPRLTAKASGRGAE